MRTLQFARSAGREERKRVGDAVEGLGDRLVRHLKSKNIDVVAVSAEQLDGGRAEIDVVSGVIQYNEVLDAAKLVEALAHELGHLVMHGRLIDPDAPFDPVLASAYGDAGPAAIARYSPRAREEAEANAFAVAFVCPGDRLFEMWLSEPDVTIDALADRMAVRPEIVRVQLANVLHDLAIGDDATKPPKSHDIKPTPEQRDAATCTGRPALIDAGPGTGKTATLIGRVEYLLTDLGVPAQQILVVTFSNEAAQELTERVSDRFGRAVADCITTSTFHGFGMEFLHLHGGLLRFENNPLLMDEDAQAEVMYEIIGRVSCPNLIVLRDPWETADKLVEHVNHCKHFLIPPDAVEDEAVNWAANGASPKEAAAARELVAIYREYERLKNEREQVDFADLIRLPLQLLESNAEVRAAWRTKFPYVLVDEFQDVSRATSRLLRALCGDENPPWVVGDARQAIYRFLGASPENVTAFQREFSGAMVFPLAVNYRSSDPIISAANELASLMNPNQPVSWTRGSDAQPLGPEAVAIAEATSDRSERIGIADQIHEWIQRDQVAPGDIAVLGRRHVDVRETMLALEDAGIRAQAAGLLTAEGAAGDLAAVLALADSQLAALPRLVYALGRDSLQPAELNAMVSALLKSQHVESEITRQIEKAREAAERERFSGDGWIALTTYLFESSLYLRRVLESADTAERAMSLIEIVSTLSLATTYRATHKGVRPRDARIGFAERLRVRLTETIPLPLMPKQRADSVRVMTCHASKGLEFPCVIVSSQTVPNVREKYPWLPPSLRPSKNEDDEQANSLLFVGVTRAKRAVVVSYPTHAGQSTLAKAKRIVPLLELWRALGRVPLRRWDKANDTNVAVIAGPLWGLRARSSIKASALDSNACPLLTYLEQYLGIRFPEEETVLYPRFFGAVRRILRRIAMLANDIGHRLEEGQVRGLVDEEWPADRFQDHPHYAMYRGIATDIALGFAREFSPLSGSVMMDPEIQLDEDETKPTVSLDLVAYFRQPNGSAITVAFRPESFATKVKNGVLLWSKLDENKRIPLVLAESRGGVGTTVPKVFSGIDGRIYPFQWSREKDSLGNQTADLVARFRALADFDFTTEATPYKCDRCRARVTCPHWIGALES